MDFIEVYPDALHAALCERLIQAFEAHPGVGPGRAGHQVDPGKKRSRDLTLDAHPDLAPLKQALLQAALPYVVRYFKTYSMALMGAVSVTVKGAQDQPTTLNIDNFDALGAPRAEALVGYLYRSGAINLQHYARAQGGYPHWHSEQFPEPGTNEALHRVLLYMFYLNDVAEGGETEFYYQARRIQPCRGSLVIAPAGFTHTHRGAVPRSGDKYIATSWVMFNRAEQLYGRPG